MKLTYRGATYEYNPTSSVNVSDSPTEGTYRGAHFSFHEFKLPKVWQPTFEFIYRGVHFKGQSNTAGAL